MRLFNCFSSILTVLAFCDNVAGSVASAQILQDIISYDEFSIKINDTRIFLFSGEFHPFRLPVPGLWLDIFQKIKAVGFNAVSFYVDWALLEGKQGDFSAEGVFALEPFFEAAKDAGVYLIARPGPYINAEASGGGFPGWLQRIPDYLREANTPYLEAVKFFESQIGPIIAKGQITNGGPVILVQPENEYSSPQYLLSHSYMQDVQDWYRDAGIVLPFISNDGYAYGNFAPGTGVGAVDIYGYDSYPLGFNCAKPYVWAGLSNQYFPGLSPPTNTPTNSVAIDPRWNDLHALESPSTPHYVAEFQGGSFDSWGGAGFEACATFTGAEFERVFYKNDYSFGLKGINLYMLYGGTNWGNMGFAVGYTSYDYGAAIKEDRTLTREKYAELKLQANFFKVSPSWLIANPKNFTNRSEYANTDAITVTALTTNKTSFWVIRHSNYSSFDSTDYQLTLPTTSGQVTIPQLGGVLSLHGRDSKIMVVDYLVGNYTILYSTAEIFTWQTQPGKIVLVAYAGPDETNEFAIKSNHGEKVRILEGALEATALLNDSTVVQWRTNSQRAVFTFGALEVYLLDRYSAYNYWVVDARNIGTPDLGSPGSVILKAGYLVRNATIEADTLHVVGDTNQTTSVELLGFNQQVRHVTWNGRKLCCRWAVSTHNLLCSISFSAPHFELPDLSKLEWHYADSLPEVLPTYEDAAWTKASNTYTNNTQKRNLTTPTSLYSTDYGFNTGTLIYRTHFIANGNESILGVETQGGSAYGVSMWLNQTFLGSWVGKPGTSSYYLNVTLPILRASEIYTITVVQDMMGLEESGPIGPTGLSKTPRGVLNYNLAGHEASTLSWLITGNLGGENYQDRVRGPLNEGGMYAERQGWHQPYPPTESSDFSSASPYQGLQSPGIAFYTTSFTLDMPFGWDIPLSFVFDNITTSSAYRAQLFLNGYQFGKYISNIGPQTSFLVPEGILDYHGKNWLALTLWALEEAGAGLQDFRVSADAVIESGYGSPDLSPMPRWSSRAGAY